MDGYYMEKFGDYSPLLRRFQNRKFNIGLQQYEISCSEYKQDIIEDEVIWFEQ